MLDLVLMASRLLIIAVIYVFLWRVSREVVRGVFADQRGSGPVTENPGDNILPCLVVVSTRGEPPAGASFVINGEITIGRGPENQIPVKDSFTSWRHAVLYLKKRRVFVEDLGSKNGTFVNGKRIKRAVALKSGDRLMVGDTMFEFRE